MGCSSCGQSDQRPVVKLSLIAEWPKGEVAGDVRMACGEVAPMGSHPKAGVPQVISRP